MARKTNKEKNNLSKAQLEKLAKAKVKKLREMELDDYYEQRGRRGLLLVSLFMNLTFLVTIYVILVNR